jgi:hypothetical protein
MRSRAITIAGPASSIIQKVRRMEGWAKILNARVVTNDGSQRRPLIYIMLGVRLEPLDSKCCRLFPEGWFSTRKCD